MPPISKFEQMQAVNIGNTLTDIFTATDDCYFKQLDVTGPDTTGVQIELRLFRASTSTESRWLTSVPLPVGSTLQILEGTPLVLKAGDIIRARCVTPGETIDINGSYIDKVNL